MTYDFEADTRIHIAEVAARLDAVCEALRHRAAAHDASEFGDAERRIYSDVVPRLQLLRWGIPEYSAVAAELGPALRHHHNKNSHHPEYYQNGVRGMDLIDVIEMYCDWAAASLRIGDGDMVRSLAVNAERHSVEGPLRDILWNTWQRFGGCHGGPAGNASVHGE